MITTLHVQQGGLHTTVQDLGRYGWQSMGVPVSGALDATALRVANTLVGNAPDVAALEILGTGPVLEVNATRVRLALAGGDASIQLLSPSRRDLPNFESFCLRRGDVLRIGSLTKGAVTYLAIEGGVNLPLVLGSHSTYTRGRFGGYHGRILASHDDVPLLMSEAPERKESRLRNQTLPGTLPIRIILGPQNDFFSPEAIDTLTNNPYTVTPAVDRMGMRLDGPRVTHTRGFNITSDGTAPGAIQVPGDGFPIILMADRQTTGGYPKIGCVISSDLATVARLRPGDTVRFELTSLEQATTARLDLENWFARLPSCIEFFTPSGIIDTTALNTENLISGVVGADDPIEPHT